MQCAYDLVLCIIRSWTKVIQRITSYPTSTPDTYIHAFPAYGKIQCVKNTDMSKALRDAATSIGKDSLGFKPKDIRTHSLRTGSAMSIYLIEVPVYTIMFIGHWLSDAFLKYIQKQVEQFSHNASQRMIQNQYFTHVPDFVPTVSLHDLRQRNHRDDAQTQQNVGSAGTSAIVALPIMAMWY